MTDLKWLDALADEIGSRIEAGNLPPQDSFGRYQLDYAAQDAADATTKRMNS